MVLFEDNTGILLRRQPGYELPLHAGDLVAVKTHDPDQTRMARIKMGPADSIRPMGPFVRGSGLEPEGATDYLLAWVRDEVITSWEHVRGTVVIGERLHYGMAA